MGIISIVHRAIRYPYNYIRRRGSSNIKQLCWDREYRLGMWDRIDDTAGDCIYPYLEKYVANGSILDLGCGPGNTANELAASTYQSYLGIDISDVALNKARQRTQQSGRTNKNTFVNSDFVSYVPPQQFDVILLRESIYHVALGQIRAMLDRYARFLTDRGVFIVRLVTGNKLTSKARVNIIESEFDVVEKAEQGADDPTVVVFRPKPAALQH